MVPTEMDAKMRILYAAKKLFAGQGFEGTTVRQISEEAGTNVALVSYYFGGKENVFIALYDTFFHSNSERLKGLEELGPIEGLIGLVDGVVRYRRTDTELACITEREIQMNGPRAHQIKRYTIPVWRLLRRFLSEGKEQGLFHYRSLDQSMVHIMGVMLFAKRTVVLEDLREEPLPSIEDDVRDALQFIFGGLHASELLTDERRRMI